MGNFRIRINVFACVITALSIALFTHCAAPLTKKDESKEEALVTVPSRQNVKQKFIKIKPENPTAVVVLFAGGNGNLELSSIFGSIVMGGKAKDNFLVRSRKLFADHGFVVAVLDAPSDHKNMTALWRMSAEHIEDVKNVIQNLKKEFNLPVWLIGTSRGTFSASGATIKLSNTLDGLVLCSSVTRVRKKFNHSSTHPNGIISMDLADIKIPTLIIAHKEDRCVASPAKNAEKLKDTLVNATKIDLIVYTGGKKPKDEIGCSYWGAHSYYGLEDKVVSDIADFIKSN